MTPIAAFLVGMLVGLIVGGCAGVMLMAVIVAGSDDND